MAAVARVRWTRAVVAALLLSVDARGRAARVGVRDTSVVVRHTGGSPEPLRAVVRLRVSAALHPDSSAARLRLAQRNAAQSARRQLPACPLAL